jgi:hypothetical protein
VSTILNGRSRYRDGFGLPSDGIVGLEFEHGVVAFFELQAGVRLALWMRTEIAHDTALPLSCRSPTEVALVHNVGRRENVDAVMAQAARAAGPDAFRVDNRSQVAAVAEQGFATASEATLRRDGLVQAKHPEEGGQPSTKAAREKATSNRG